jgi:predicted neuraminidase
MKSQSGLLKIGFVYETAPFSACHASTIVENSRAQLVAAWFGGTCEQHPDVGIWVSHHECARWNVPVEVANGIQEDGTRHPTWNPVLFQPKGAPLMLFYKVGPTPETWWGMLRTSDDGGKTWNAARRLPDGILGPIKNKPVQLPNGDIISPASDETPETPSKWTVHFERSRNLGRTWERSSSVNDGISIQAIQPSILFMGGERLLAIGRSRQDRLFQISSEDGGYSWGTMALGTLPNNNSGTDALTLTNGTHLIVYNHVGGTPGEWGGERTPLNVAISTDGKHWNAALVLESGAGEYSYPAVIQANDGLVHVTYTWNRQRIRHCIIDPTQLKTKAIIDSKWPTD